MLARTAIPGNLSGLSTYCNANKCNTFIFAFKISHDDVSAAVTCSLSSSTSRNSIHEMLQFTDKQNVNVVTKQT